MTVAQQIRYKAERIAAFVATQRKGLREDRPLLVSMQGPQGCGEFSGQVKGYERGQELQRGAGGLQ